MLDDANNELRYDIPYEVLEEIVEKIDLDKNKAISFDEFIGMVRVESTFPTWISPFQKYLSPNVDPKSSSQCTQLNARDLANEHPLVSRLITYATLITVPRAERRSVQHRYLDEYRCIAVPFSIFTLSLLQLVFFVFYVIKYGGVNGSNISTIDDKFVYNPHRRAEVSLSACVRVLTIRKSINLISTFSRMNRSGVSSPTCSSTLDFCTCSST